MSWAIPEVRVSVLADDMNYRSEMEFMTESFKQDLLEWLKDPQVGDPDQLEWKRFICEKRNAILKQVDDELLSYILYVKNNSWNFSERTIFIPVTLVIPSKRVEWVSEFSDEPCHSDSVILDDKDEPPPSPPSPLSSFSSTDNEEERLYVH